MSSLWILIYISNITISNIRIRNNSLFDDFISNCGKPQRKFFKLNTFSFLSEQINMQINNFSFLHFYTQDTHTSIYADEQTRKRKVLSFSFLLFQLLVLFLFTSISRVQFRLHNFLLYFSSLLKNTQKASTKIRSKTKENILINC